MAEDGVLNNGNWPLDCDEHGVDEGSKMILWRVRLTVVHMVGDFWAKPICTCPPCMASVWGTPVYWAFAVMQGLTWTHALAFIPYICVVSALSKWLNSITE